MEIVGEDVRDAREAMAGTEALFDNREVVDIRVDTRPGILRDSRRLLYINDTVSS